MTHPHLGAEAMTAPNDVAALVECEAARKAVQELGALLSTRPHSRDPDLSGVYFEWVQRVEKAHAAIRDALDRDTSVATIAALQAEVERAKEALAPFAEAADGYEPPEGDDHQIAWAHDFTIGSLRRARSASRKETTP